MQDARTVGGLQRTANLHTHPQHFGHTELLATRPAQVVVAGVVLHDDVRPPVGGDIGMDDGDDERVRTHLRHQVCLGSELTALHISTQRVADEHLHRDLAVRHLLFVEEHVGVPAGADQFDRRVAREGWRLGDLATAHRAATCRLRSPAMTRAPNGASTRTPGVHGIDMPLADTTVPLVE